MAVPHTGALGILTAPQSGACGNNCSSLSFAVLGNMTPAVSMLNLGSVAGKSVPFTMLSFHDFASLTCKCVNLCEISTSKPYNSVSENAYLGSYYSYPMSLSECWYPNVNWYFNKPLTTGSKTNSISILCNGTIKACCTISSTPAFSCSGSWNACFLVKKDDTLQFCIVSQIQAGNALAAYGCIQLASITNVVGCFCLGATCLTISENTCGAIE
jgi:hypothetical protein